MLRRGAKHLKWAMIVLAVSAFAFRFAYGREHEISTDGTFSLSGPGVLLTIGTIVFGLGALVFHFVDQWHKERGPGR